MTKRGRTERREAERRLDKLTRDRRKLFGLEPGGRADNPIEVVSASVIEPHARALECPRCGPTMRLHEQTSSVVAGRVHRAVTLRCFQCGEERPVHYAIVAPLLQ